MSLGLGMPATLRKTSQVTDTTAFMRTALAGLAAGPTVEAPERKPRTDSASNILNRDSTSVEEKRLLQASIERRNVIIKTIATTARKIIIKVYDNGVEDGDSISIIHNNTIIASRVAVRLQPVSFEISLDDVSIPHHIILVAHNLGYIPPNTATIEITAGTKKYILNAASDLGSNATIRVIYGDD
jgi:archaellum component FlaF (FlaF/FlaG flagellin family)